MHKRARIVFGCDVVDVQNTLVRRTLPVVYHYAPAWL